MTEVSEEDIKEFTELISLDLENGDIDKVVSLFQYNKNLYATLGRLLTKGSMFVRLGVNMLLEDLKEIKPDEVIEALPYLIPLLNDENATIRGDVADLISNIGNESHIDLITPLLKDSHSQVQEIAKEAIEILRMSKN
ncbi:HEAT repeat domain-containing protein [bacterium]|nr:HEAT repeat domain-containing protein [bacterium]